MPQQIPVTLKILKANNHPHLGLLYFRHSLNKRLFDNYQVNPMPEKDRVSYLVRFDKTDEADCDALWDLTYTAGLLDASAKQSRSIVLNRRRKDYEYDPETGKYRYVGSGYAVSSNRLLKDIDIITNAGNTQIRELSLKLVNNQITLEYWYNQMQKIMKALYLDTWLVNIGGKQNFVGVQKTYFAEFVQKQFLYLDRLLIQIQSGQQPLNGRFVTRAQMYANHTRAIYQNKKLLQMMELEYQYARRVRTAKESCPDCIHEARRGWTRIENVVPIGDTVCRSNCKCHFLYKKSRER